VSAVYPASLLCNKGMPVRLANFFTGIHVLVLPDNELRFAQVLGWFTRFVFDFSYVEKEERLSLLPGFKRLATNFHETK
jgi:hypothetical protein